MNNKLTDFSEVDEVFFTTRNGLSLIPLNDKPFYHISDCLRPLISDLLDRAGNASQDDQKGGRDNA
ncbi:hypothetical protein [Microcystis wesenbergii]|uniref:Uncharacterized protein n=1 Tax=Microcystis wesenbergii NRERC-220 TaxID=3068991 RepID=A0ABU3HV40_9CHRO|nr:hypothetical protein [Microcystis wesenbergii]MDT3677193.1 hypothetical protein [Microcystis wesenbergii NRERC-220]